MYDGLLYFNQSNQSILSCLDSKTGETVMDRTRLSGISNMVASPVGANGINRNAEFAEAQRCAKKEGLIAWDSAVLCASAFSAFNNEA